MADAAINESYQRERKSGFLVLMSLLAFFVVFASVDAFFIYKALSTHTGVIEEHTYEKGLAFNQALEQARIQGDMDVEAAADYKDGILTFTLTDKKGQPFDGAIVKATIIRPVQDGYDFETVLQYKGQGQYQTKLDLPLQGLWQAQIEAKWDIRNQHNKYQKELSFIHQ